MKKKKAGWLSFRILQMVPQVRSKIIWLALVNVAMICTYIVQGLLIAQVMTKVITGQISSQLFVLGAGLLAMMICRSAIILYRDSAGIKAAEPVKEELRKQLFAKLMLLGPGWLASSRTGNTQASLVAGVETFDAYIGRFLPQVLAAVVGVLVTSTIMIAISPIIGFTVLACSLLLPVIPRLSKRLLASRSIAWFGTYQAMYSDILDAIQGMTTLKAFNAEETRAQQLDKQADKFNKESAQVNTLTLLYVGIVSFVTAAAAFLALIVGAKYFSAGAFTTFQLFTILMLTRECFRPMQELQKAYHSGSPAQFSSRSIFAVLDAEPIVSSPTTPLTISVNENPPQVIFDDVSFSYPGRNSTVLHGFSMSINPGKQVAVVGHSGTGKTTLVSLLFRFFDPSSGKISINGQNIEQIKIEELRSLLAVVSQDTYLFHGTVRDNLLIGNPNATDDELEQAAKTSQAHDFIMDMPQGYDTVIAERGASLSGGQRQRIAIARALLKNAPILILDEATSSVDGRNEAEIMHALRALSTGRTTLVIAHRLSTVKDSDEIIVLDRGRAVEQGTHNELLAQNGAYSQLIAAQKDSI